MYNVETLESLHAYASRLQPVAPRVATRTVHRRAAVRALVRRVRRAS